MEYGGSVFMQQFHLPKVSHVMLRSGGRCGAGEIQHSEAGFDQPSHQSLNPLFRASTNFTRSIRACVGRVNQMPRNLFVGGFIPQEMSQLPIGNGEQFADHVAESSRDELLWSCGQRWQVGKDRKRRSGNPPFA